MLVLATAGFFVYKDLSKTKLPENTKQISFVDETKNPKAPEITDKTQKTVPLIQSVPYVDLLSKFSINLPTGWSILSKENTETTSKISFSNPSAKDVPSAKITVERLERNAGMNKNIKEMGEDAVLLLLADDLGVSLGLTKPSIKKISINGVNYFQLSGVYVGQASKKEVTQNVYFALTPDAHYRIGVDAYTDVWVKDKDAILQSINSLFLK